MKNRNKIRNIRVKVARCFANGDLIFLTQKP